jgi:hypothetical protein
VAAVDGAGPLEGAVRDDLERAREQAAALGGADDREAERVEGGDAHVVDACAARRAAQVCWIDLIEHDDADARGVDALLAQADDAADQGGGLAGAGDGAHDGVGACDGVIEDLPLLVGPGGHDGLATMDAGGVATRRSALAAVEVDDRQLVGGRAAVEHAEQAQVV